MKKIIILLILMFPCIVYASYSFNKSNAISKSQDLIIKYIDYDEFLVYEGQIPYSYDGSNLEYNSLYPKSGFINRFEYLTAGGVSSYHFDGSSYWTMTNYNSSNSYIVAQKDIQDYISNNDSTSVRNTVYIRQGVTILGTGKYSDPWIFDENICSFLTINLGNVGGYFEDSTFKLKYEMVPGEKMTLPIPVSENYNFIGWNPSIVSNTFVMGNSDVELLAKWEKKEFKLTLDLSSSASTEFSDKTIKKEYTLYNGQTFDTPKPLKKGYVFDGWNIVSGNVSTTGSSVTMGNQDTVLSPKWKSEVHSFSYTGGVQTFTPEYTGYYQLEVWGAQGGPSNALTMQIEGFTLWGGYGGYSTGATLLTAGVPIYITVGGGGTIGNYKDRAPVGGYNGGGNSVVNIYDENLVYNGSGGGATHISVGSGGVLSQFSSNYSTKVLIVAGGGGGFHNHENARNSGGAGGGYVGSNNSGYPYKNGRFNYFNYCTFSTGGTQSSGGNGYNYSGAKGKFGQGANNVAQVNSIGGAGGGGLWGGGAGGHDDSCCNSGSGGSGYIANSKLVSLNTSTNYNVVNKRMYCYKCATSTAASTYTVSTNDVSITPVSGKAKSGNGYAVITYLSAN